MNLETKQVIVSELQGYMQRHGLTQTDVAKKSGVRKEYINEIIKPGSAFNYNAGAGHINPIPVKWFYTLAELIGYPLEKVYWQVQPTAQMKVVLATLQDAKEFGYANIIIGETGCGKTYATDLFVKRNPTDCYKITVSQSDNLKDLLDKIIGQIRVKSKQTKSRKLRDISAFFRKKKVEGALPLLIFDEAEYMTQPALCAIKELYDSLHSYCGIVLIGTDQLIRKIEVMNRRNKDGIPQFYRRIKFGIRVLPDVDRKFGLFLNDVDLELSKFLVKHCDNYGELHDVLVPALREADRTGEELNEAFVRKVLHLSA